MIRNREPQHRCWFCTLNNWTEEEYLNARSVVQSTYVLIGKEVGEQCGTPHLHAVFHFVHAISMRTLKERLKSNRWNCQVVKSLPASITYCKKDNDFYEMGEMPKQGKRTDLHEAADHLREHNDMQATAEMYPAVFIRYYRGLQALQSIRQPKRAWKTFIVWMHGPTGSGKSRLANKIGSEYSQVYWKMNGNHWWDGYQGQKIVIIDDYRLDLCKFNYLLRLLDRYPMIVEVKGSSVEFSARVILITAPQSPLMMWSGRCEEDLAQLSRRIEIVQQFPCSVFEEQGIIDSVTQVLND